MKEKIMETTKTTQNTQKTNLQQESPEPKPMLIKQPSVFCKQMEHYDLMKDDILDYFNSRISDVDLKLNANELYLENERILFETIPLAVSLDAEHLFDLLGNLGSTAVRFNIAIDKIFALLGHDFLIRKGFYDQTNIQRLAHHPLIFDYGTKEPYNNKTICIDRDACYSFYSTKNESRNPIIIDDFAHESEFIKEIIKRSLYGYFYKDIHSVGIFQKVYSSPDGGIQVTLLQTLSNYTSLLDLLTNIIDFVFEIDIAKTYKFKTVYFKKGEMIPNDEKPSAIRVNWSNIDLILEVLKSKSGKHTQELHDIVKRWQSFLRKSPTIHEGRNIITHRGCIHVEKIRGEEKGIFITFCTDARIVKENDPSMKVYFDSVNYCLSNYSIILKLYNDFYGVLFKAIMANETIFKPIQVL
jgi:hypothetical protein